MFRTAGLLLIPGGPQGKSHCEKGLFEHFIGESEYRRRDVDPKRGRPEIGWLGGGLHVGALGLGFSSQEAG